MPETQQKVLPAPVYWAQRSSLVYVKIAVEDVKTPDIKVEKDKIVYKGVGGNKQEYVANLELFDEIKPEDSKFIVRDRGTEFVLIKAKEGPFWKRLLKSNEKFHWLKVDFNKWKDEDDSDGGEDAPGGGGTDFEDMMRQMGGLGGMGGMGGMGADMPDLGDLDDEKDGGPDSDDEELPELEEK